MKILVTILICSYSISCLNAQEKLRYKEVSAQEFNAVPVPDDKDADALVLFDVGSMRFAEPFSFSAPIKNTFLERHLRILILRESGISNGNFKLSFSTDDNFETVYDVKGATHNLLPGGKIETKELGKKDVIEEALSKRVSQKVFALPDVKKGSIIEITYKKRRGTYFTLEDWYFQHSIPCLYSEYKTYIPQYFEYNYLRAGNDEFSFTDSFYIYKTPPPVEPGTFEKYTMTVSRFIMKNIPALTDEPYMSSKEDFLDKINFQLATVKYPGYPDEKIVQTWQKLSRELVYHESFGKELTKKIIPSDKLSALAGANQKETMINTFNFIKNSINWNGNRSLFSCTSLDATYKKKEGCIGDINLLLSNALSHQGIKNELLLLSTRSNGKVFTTYPYIGQFNYVIVTAVIDSVTYYLDASRKYSTYLMLPYEVLNTNGITVNEASPQWKPLTSKIPFKQRIVISSGLNEENKLFGIFKAAEYGYANASRQNQYKSGEEKEFVQKTFQKKFEQSKIDSIKIEPGDDIEGSFSTQFSFNDESTVQATSDKIYISPVLFTNFLENNFKSETRISEVNFGYNFDINYTFLFDIPQGYKAEEIPLASKIYLPGNSFTFFTETVVEGNKLRFHFTLKSSSSIYAASDYKAIKQFFEKVEQSGLQKIVLKKI